MRITDRQHHFAHAPLARLPGSILVVDNLAARGRLIRELCRAMRCAANHVTQIEEAGALVARGGIAAAIVDLDAFGRRALAEIAIRNPELPVLIAVEPSLVGTTEMPADLLAFGLTNPTVVPRPLTTRLLRVFLAEAGVSPPRRRRGV